ncbi:MAG: hypothetical protein PsegKO_36380 [Pseudohongiellaceae bacterium]
MKFVKNTWAAWHNMMPPGPQMLHVAGDLDIGNNHTGATLVFDSLEKSNPPNLVLRVVPRTIFIPRDEDDHVVRLHYFDNSPPGSYQSIKIVLDDKLALTIKYIQTAH